MNESQRNSYLAAMQIDRWLPRVSLPYAATSTYIEPVDPPAAKETAPLLVAQNIVNKVTNTTVNKEIIIQPPVTVASPSPVPDHTTATEIPHFSLQLMQSGNCLLLIELATGQALQIRDPAYQLLRNILKAAKLPDSPQLLGDVIHWPLFKQVSIPQGAKEAQEFLQSYLTTYQEQLPNNKCLWLMGLPAIEYVAGLTEQNLYQSPIVEPLGQTLLAPSLEFLIEQPQAKASLWQSIKQLIPLWQA